MAGNNNHSYQTYSLKLPSRSQPKVLQQILWSGILAGNRGSDVEQELSDWVLVCGDDGHIAFQLHAYVMYM
jgi:hypothetical protein